jgi:protoheme ferro-lyase
VDLADETQERRFFGEVIMTASVILNLGTPEQQARVRQVLDELASRDDPIIADFARWALDTPITDDELADWYPHPMER